MKVCTAHIIRSMTTKLFKSMKRLRANFRWCLTGTPIQNSLEDLAALVNFIQSSPLDDFHVFKKHIISPLMKGSGEGVDNLRQLLDSVCLRRTKELLNLPKAIFESRLLDFSPREKRQYVETRDKLVRMINQNRLQPQNKGCLGVFQLQLQLRRLCNHGTFQKSSVGVEDFDPEQAIAHLRKLKQARCEVCNGHVTGIHGIEEQRSGSFTMCGHLLCSKCIPKMKGALQKINGRDGCLKCSLCPETIFGEYLVTEEASSKPSRSVNNKTLSAWQYFDKDGCSTKISAVVAEIEQHKAEGKR
jgi:SNF2 family DNA or RNA helicase